MPTQESPDLMGLINEKYSILHRRREAMWATTGLVPVTVTEWHVLSRVRDGSSSISEVARAVNISRQATHKCIRSLQDKGILTVDTHPDNRRNRVVSMTDFGHLCYAQNLAFRLEVEQQVEASIGAEQLCLLKDILDKIPPE